MSENIIFVTAPAGLHATVRGTCTPVVALAVVRIVDYLEGDNPEAFDVVKAVVAGSASEDGLADMASCHDASECSAHMSARHRPPTLAHAPERPVLTRSESLPAQDISHFPTPPVTTAIGGLR